MGQIPVRLDFSHLSLIEFDLVYSETNAMHFNKMLHHFTIMFLRSFPYFSYLFPGAYTDPRVRLLYDCMSDDHMNANMVYEYRKTQSGV